jgi:hypothetical protein
VAKADSFPPYSMGYGLDSWIARIAREETQRKLLGNSYLNCRFLIPTCEANLTRSVSQSALCSIGIADVVAMGFPRPP